MEYSVKESKDGRWDVVKDDGEVVTTFDTQSQAWSYAERKSTHPLWQTRKGWRRGKAPGVVEKDKIVSPTDAMMRHADDVGKRHADRLKKEIADRGPANC